MLKIDSHVHIGLSEKIERGWSLKDYIKIMNINTIEKSIIIPNISSIRSLYSLNKELITQYKNLSTNEQQRFILFLLIDPLDPEVFDQINDNKNIVRGLKYHPSLHQIPINDVRLGHFISLAEKNAYPILVHCGRNNISSVTYLISAAQHNKDVLFIGAHMAGNASDLIEKAIIILEEYKLDNIKLDTSAVKLPFLIEKGVKKLGVNNILFGSDEPYSDVRVGISCLNYTNLTDSEKEKVFYENSKQLISFGR